MQNDIKTKSTDYLPGKPSIDSVAKSNTALPNTDSNMQPAAAPASAHVIDLKNASMSPVDSPLLSAEEPINPTKIAPPPSIDNMQKSGSVKSEISVKPISSELSPQTSQPAPPQDQTLASSTSASAPSNSETTNVKTDIDNLSLVDESKPTETAKNDQPKKSKKLKWLLLAILFIIVGVGIAVGVIYLLNTVTL